MKLIKLNESGFSLVELITVMAVTLILTATIFSFTIDFWGTSATLQADQETLVTRLDANDALRKLISASAGMIIQNSIPDSKALVKDPNTGNGQYWTPIHAIPGNKVVGNPGTITPLLYFRIPSQDKTHTVVMNGAVPYDDEYILYLNGTNKQMYLRQLANPNVNNNLIETSCTPGSTTSTCPADRMLVDSITSIDLRYFSRSGNLIDWTSSTDPALNGTQVGNPNNYNGPDFPLVEAVEIGLHIKSNAQFHGVNNSVNQTVVRIALLNF